MESHEQGATVPQNVYDALHSASAMHASQSVMFNGTWLRIMPEEVPVGEERLRRLVPHPDVIVGDPDELITITMGDWCADKHL
jgi:hypothetical protein